MKKGMGRRRERQREREKKKWGGGTRTTEDRDGTGRQGFSFEASLLPPNLPHLNLRLALPCTYCGAAAHCGALTFVSMSYCLPTWQTSFPVLIHPLGSPNRYH